VFLSKHTLDKWGEATNKDWHRFTHHGVIVCLAHDKSPQLISANAVALVWARGERKHSHRQIALDMKPRRTNFPQAFAIWFSNPMRKAFECHLGLLVSSLRRRGHGDRYAEELRTGARRR
jgi:hypothetical protein